MAGGMAGGDTGRVLRKAQGQDLQALAAIDHVAAGGDQGRVDHLRAAVARHACVIHADAFGVPNGFVIVEPGGFFGHDFVDLLMVVESARRSGIGRMLLRHAVEFSGTGKIFTSTNRSNVPMRELLAVEKWHFSGELDGLDDDDPELVFWTTKSTSRH